MSDGMQDAIDVLRDINQLRRDLAEYHDALVAHNILQEHCDNQRKELAALNAAHAPIKGDRDAYKRQCERLAAENGKLLTLAKAMWVRIKSEYPDGGFPDMKMLEGQLRWAGVDVGDGNQG